MKRLFAPAVLCVAAAFVSGVPAQGFAMEEKARNCAGGHPCQAVFTLDEENNIVLQDISGDTHRNEGVLRLTTEQAEKAAEGPTSRSNILAPELQEDEFSDTIRALAAVPGLRFLQGESPGGRSKAGGSSGGSTGTRAYSKLPAQCRQIKTVMEATLEDARAGKLDTGGGGGEFISPEEVKAVCPQARAQSLNRWYADARREFLSQ